jgi:hypothetical protein
MTSTRITLMFSTFFWSILSESTLVFCIFIVQDGNRIPSELFQTQSNSTNISFDICVEYR